MSLDRRTYEEKRNFIRVPVECEVALAFVVNGKRFRGTGKDLSGGGILFHTEELLEPGDRLELHIETSQAQFAVLDATIEVVRVRPLAEERRYAVGSAIRTIHG
jgi:hypothetical protein